VERREGTLGVKMGSPRSKLGKELPSGQQCHGHKSSVGDKLDTTFRNRGVEFHCDEKVKRKPLVRKRGSMVTR